ncbi:MAG: redoxin domain-containing protein [Saprospiraceae bacterium]
MPRIGEKAPDFEAITTTGKLKLSEYNKDSWVMIFSHPADFTPVCTTEMSGFAVNKNGSLTTTPN